jgi:hypothetical protein
MRGMSQYKHLYNHEDTGIEKPGNVVIPMLNNKEIINGFISLLLFFFVK